MRKVKLELRCRVPSWGFCNKDEHTADGRYSKELCRFCQKAKAGYRCLLYDANLTADPNFVNKAPQCIDATAGYAITVDEPQPTRGPTIDPQMIARETLKLYNKTLGDLLNQRYPRHLAEKIAMDYVLSNK